jgi:hypothetical protein
MAKQGATCYPLSNFGIYYASFAWSKGGYEVQRTAAVSHRSVCISRLFDALRAGFFFDSRQPLSIR